MTTSPLRVPPPPTGGGQQPGQQHYSLRWNNHQSHVLSAFDALLQNESLVDCTLVCEDTNVKAHKVVLSACSPYFQKIFMDNPCKHPIIVLKDIRGWEVQCIVDFMYKGETSVPETQLTGLIKAAESLKVRGLTSSDQQLPQGLTLETMHNGYGTHISRTRAYSPSSTYDAKHARSHSSQSSPMSLTHQDEHAAANAAAHAANAAAPRRKQARPRRRSGDSVGNSLDLSGKSAGADSPPSSLHSFRKSPAQHPHQSMDVDNAPENLSLKRPSSSPAINLVKTESLLEDKRHHASPSAASSSTPGTPASSTTEHPFHQLDRAAHMAGLHHHEHEARVEALQALNFMAAGGGLPHFPHPGLGLPPHSGSPHHHAASVAAAAAAAAAAAHAQQQQHANGANRPSSTPSAPSNAYGARGSKSQHSAPRGGPPRSWTNDELTKALENVWNKRMTTSQASRIYGIPYNSLLMYVRGKYGKSLKLDVLKQQTPAAKDNLNTIGNSRSTPKEKLAAEKHKHMAAALRNAAYSPYGTRSNESSSPGLNPFMFQNLQEQMGGLLGILPQDSSRMTELLQNVHREQQNARQSDSNDDASGAKHSPNDVTSSSVTAVAAGGSGLLMMPSGSTVGSTSDARSLSRSPVTSEQSAEENQEKEEDDLDEDMPEEEDKKTEEDQEDNNNRGPSPIDVNLGKGGEISAL